MRVLVKQKNAVLREFDSKFVKVQKCEWTDCIFSKEGQCDKNDIVSIVLIGGEWLCEDYREE